MSKTLVLGDLHVWNHRFCGGPLQNGINRRCREILDSVFQAVMYYRSKYGIEHVVQLGDFFDGPRPSPAILLAAMEMIEATGLEWHILAGNHDISAYDAPTAVAPLGHLQNVYVYEQAASVDIGGATWAMVPYIGPDAHAAILQAKDILGTAKFAAIHYGFCETKHPSRTDVLVDADVDQLKTVQNSVWLFGHEHTSTHARKSSVSCGAFSALNFSDVGKLGASVIVASSERVEGSCWYHNTPRFRELDSSAQTVEDLRSQLRWPRTDFSQYLYVTQAQEALAKEGMALGWLTGYQVRPPASVEAPGLDLGVLAGGSSAVACIWDCAAESTPEEYAEAVADLLTNAIQENQT